MRGRVHDYATLGPWVSEVGFGFWGFRSWLLCSRVWDVGFRGLLGGAWGGYNPKPC